MAIPAYTRLFDYYAQDVPANQVLEFDSAAAVGNYFGANSPMYTELAQEYFTGPHASQATMLVEREDQNQRPHLLGANLWGKSLPQISGTISIKFRDMVYQGKVNLAKVTGFSDLALKVREALNSNKPIVAVTTGDTITPVYENFTGWTQGAVLHEDAGYPYVPVGSLITGAGITDPQPYGNQIIRQANVQPDGSSNYTSFFIMSPTQTPDEPLQASWGIMHIGHVVSGQVKAGMLVSEPGVVGQQTAIIQDLGHGNWLVNNAQRVSGNFQIAAPSLSVEAQQRVGVTENNDFLEIQPQSEFGYDEEPSGLSFASGSLADALGLTRASGAHDSTPGGQNLTTYQMLNHDLLDAERNGTPFTSFQQALGLRGTPSFATWAASHGETYLPLYNSTTPAGE